MYKTFNKMHGATQYVAPYRYAFYNANGECLGRIVWLRNVEGIYIDKNDNIWGL